MGLPAGRLSELRERSAGQSESEILANYPGLTREDILACFSYASYLAHKDRTLLERAETDGTIVLTLDKDFWQIALQRPIPLKRCGVILFRLYPAIPETLEPLVDSTLRAEHSWIRHVSMVTKESKSWNISLLFVVPIATFHLGL